MPANLENSAVATGLEKVSFHSNYQLSIVLISHTSKFSSVQSLSPVRLFRTHASQHSRPPCPSPTPGVHSNTCPSSWWCHPAISSSVIPFSSCPQYLTASESFPMTQLLAWGGQSIGVSASTSVLPRNTQDWSPLGITGFISLQSKGLSTVFSSTTVPKYTIILMFKTNFGFLPAKGKK